MTDLRRAAQAVVERWDTPAWEWRDQGPTADLMADLRTALAQPSCVGKDPRCPCQDGDQCHYKDCGNTKALPVPQAEPVAREGFEKWAKSLPNYIDLSRFETGYSDCNADYAWAAWQAALAQPEPPAEWPLIKNILDEYGLDAIAFVAEWKLAQRPWVGLEAEEILDLFDRTNVYGSKWIEFARTVEARLKEKNDY